MEVTYCARTWRSREIAMPCKMCTRCQVAPSTICSELDDLCLDQPGGNPRMIWNSTVRQDDGQNHDATCRTTNNLIAHCVPKAMSGNG